MKKRIITLVLATVTALSLVACGGDEPIGTETNSEVSDAIENGVSKNDTEIGDSWDSMKVTISGTELALPCAYSNMPAGNSITVDYRNVGANRLMSYPYKWDAMMQDTDISTVSLYNPTSESVDVVDALIYGISVKFYSEQEINHYAPSELPQIILPSEITFLSGEDEVLEAYGEPDEIHSPTVSGYNYGKKYTYQKDDKTLIIYLSSTAVGTPKVIGFEYYMTVN